MLGNIFSVNLAKFLTPLTLTYHWVNIRFECSINPKAPKFKLPLSFKYVFMIYIMKVLKSCYFKNHVLFICCITQLWTQHMLVSMTSKSEPTPTDAPWMMDGKHRVMPKGWGVAWHEMWHIFFFFFFFYHDI
jgi:hypothetical protein